MLVIVNNGARRQFCILPYPNEEALLDEAV